MSDKPADALRNRLDPSPEQLPAWYDISSSAMEKRGPWMREYMPSTLADLLAQTLTYAPMAVGVRSPITYGVLNSLDAKLGRGPMRYDPIQKILEGPPQPQPKRPPPTPEELEAAYRTLDKYK